MDVKNLECRKLVPSFAVSLLILFVFAASASGEPFAPAVISKVSSVVCDITKALVSIATAVAALIMTLAGIKWVASENDPGARKAAKDAMVHAIVGLIIIVIINDVILAAAGTSMCGGTT